MTAANNYSDLLYGPVHGTLGVDAWLVTAAGSRKRVRVIDDTAGVDLSGPGEAQRQVVQPAATLRASELTKHGLRPSDLTDGTLEFNGRTWGVVSYKLEPSPHGEDAGEVLVLLTKRASDG